MARRGWSRGKDSDESSTNSDGSEPFVDPNKTITEKDKKNF